jgi:uncharacterized phage protein (TIGR01671 family)
MEIRKFRVWDNVDYMSSSFTLHDLQTNKIGFTSDCIVMQYTSLKDKNGKEIYEGDILGLNDFKYKVVFEDGEYILIHINNDWGVWGSLKNIHRHDMLQLKFIIIGNIYENQELLTNTKTK